MPRRRLTIATPPKPMRHGHTLEPHKKTTPLTETMVIIRRRAWRPDDELPEAA